MKEVTVFTYEMACEVAKRAAEQGYYHPCSQGHMVPGPSHMVGVKRTLCLNCGCILVLDSK